MHDFALPSNIKQIGSIGDGLRIYMEDYVCTYLKQYAESGGHCEKVAFLVGKYLVIDNQPVLFINGAIQGKYTDYEDGIEKFTEKSFQYADKQREAYFGDFEIVGWMQSQPGYSVFLNPAYAQYHINHFKKPYETLFVIDPVEKVNAFYVWNEEQTDLLEAKGYFVYYDKNQGMQEYMLENKPMHLDMQEKEVRIRAVRGTARKKDMIEPTGAGQNRESRKQPPRRAHSVTDGKRLTNMLMSLCAVLFVICFIMGAGLIQNDDRINQLEVSLGALNSAYSYLVSQLRQNSAQPVFAQDQGQEQNQDQSQVQDQPQSQDQDQAQGQGQAVLTEATQEQATDPTPQPTPEPTPEITPAPVINILPDPADSIPETYVVQKGDNLNYISQKFYGTTDMKEAIMEANGLSDPDMIYFGKVLILPRP